MQSTLFWCKKYALKHPAAPKKAAKCFQQASTQEENLHMAVWRQKLMTTILNWIFCRRYRNFISSRNSRSLYFDWINLLLLRFGNLRSRYHVGLKFTARIKMLLYQNGQTLLAKAMCIRQLYRLSCYWNEAAKKLKRQLSTTVQF